MAKYQYRVSSDSNGTSNYGYAYLALVNPSGSGKKLTLRSLEVFLHSVQSGVSIPARLVRCAAPLDGEDMLKNAVALDSATAIPSTCKVRRNSLPVAVTVLSRIDLGRRGGAVGNQNRLIFGTPLDFGKRGRRPLGGLGNGASGGYNSEAVTLRQNEAVALVMDATAGSMTNPMRVSVTAGINGKTVAWNFNANSYPGQALFSLENTSANPVTLLAWSVMDLGTTDTPTLRVVPIGQMYAPDVADTCKQNVGVMPMDSTYPAFPGALYTDIGFIPQGVPEVEISPASAGTPAGMNYLHTRDFWGPMYRNMLVEACHMKGVGSGIPDAFGMSYGHAGADLLCRKAGITLNQGEGIAIVNSAETAVGVQAAYGAWQPMTFSAQVDVEPAASPYLNITGLVTGSDIVVLVPGTGTILQQIDAYSGSAWAWNYDPDAVTGADVCIYKPGYVPYSVRGLTLGVGGASVPVQQLADRNYQ